MEKSYSLWEMSLFPLEIRQWQFYLVGNTVSFLSGLLKLDREKKEEIRAFPMRLTWSMCSKRLKSFFSG